MTTEGVVFDTWAWWEFLLGEESGKPLRQRFVKAQITTSAWAIGELCAKLVPRVAEEDMQAILRTIHTAGPVVPVDAKLAEEGARLRVELRKREPRASLGDGVMLATARSLGLKLVSGDAAFAGQKDVVSA